MTDLHKMPKIHLLYFEFWLETFTAYFRHTNEPFSADLNIEESHPMRFLGYISVSRRSRSVSFGDNRSHICSDSFCLIIYMIYIANTSRIIMLLKITTNLPTMKPMQWKQTLFPVSAYVIHFTTVLSKNFTFSIIIDCIVNKALFISFFCYCKTIWPLLKTK